MRNQQIASRIRSITRRLRDKYYAYAARQSHYDEIPFGGSIRESIGPFPEFILKGRFCKRSLVGMCSPCFYSRLPEHDISDCSYNDGYVEQVNYIANHFDDLIISNQAGRVANSSSNNDKPMYGIVCTPTGSYFDEAEYPLNVRIQNLKTLLRAADERSCRLALHIETHVKDVLRYFASPSETELELLHNLNTRILLGFESSDDFSRNVLYNKDVLLSDFEKASSILKSNGFPVGAFVFAGLFAYNDYETIADVKRSLTYLKQYSISPVLMFANTQKFTISDVLTNGDRFKLLDSRTVMELVMYAVNLFGTDMSGDIDPWFIADPKGGPPEPNNHIFNAKTNTACFSCSNKIYDAIERLRITKDLDSFIDIYNELSSCNCYGEYKRLIKRCTCEIAAVPLHSRMIDKIEYVEENLDQYVLSEMPWVVKAEILCLGLKVSDRDMKTLLANNPFAAEKGLADAIHFYYKGVCINACISERFCEKSPYSATFINERNEWELQYKRFTIGSIKFVEIPQWAKQQYKGLLLGNIIRPHGNSCISLWPSRECYFVEEGKGCKFCCLNNRKTNRFVLRPSDVLFAVTEAKKYNTDYSINISGGTLGSADESINYLSDIVRQIRERFYGSISIECVPPQNLQLINELHNAGATAIIMNLEIYDEMLRKEVCPGKSTISRDFYFNSLRFAVSVFGRGNVSSVLIMGVQPDDDVLTAAKELINLGVIPTVMPFKPLDDTEMEKYPLPNPTNYVRISQCVAQMMHDNGLTINPCSGCASCGACSLEIDLNNR